MKNIKTFPIQIMHYFSWKNSSYLLTINFQMRNNHLINSRWPNEFDRKRWTWPKNSHQRTLTIELDQKYNQYYDNCSVWMCKRTYLGHIYPFKFVVLMNFFYFYCFGHVLMFTFVSVNFFVHILTHFGSHWIGQNN